VALGAAPAAHPILVALALRHAPAAGPPRRGGQIGRADRWGCLGVGIDRLIDCMRRRSTPRPAAMRSPMPTGSSQGSHHVRSPNSRCVQFMCATRGLMRTAASLASECLLTAPFNLMMPRWPHAVMLPQLLRRTAENNPASRRPGRTPMLCHAMLLTRAAGHGRPHAKGSVRRLKVVSGAVSSACAASCNGVWYDGASSARLDTPAVHRIPHTRPGIRFFDRSWSLAGFCSDFWPCCL